MNREAAASPSLLFVDYENVGKALDPNVIPEDVRVLVFFGALQKSVPIEFMRAVHRMGQRFVPIDIEGQGKNALDFHLTYYLGEYLAGDATASCVVLSKDKGFDILIRHLRGRGFNVRRVESIAQAFSTAAAKVPKTVTRDPPNLHTPLEQAIPMAQGDADSHPATQAQEPDRAPGHAVWKEDLCTGSRADGGDDDRAEEHQRDRWQAGL